MTNHVDIWSKGEVARYLQYLLNAKLVKDCKNLLIEQEYLDAYYPKCSKDWASWTGANNVTTDVTAYSAPSGYSWPKCPVDCTFYKKSDNFLMTMVQETLTNDSLTEDYVDISRINELKKKSSDKFDLKKLIKLCEEINFACSNNSFLSVGILSRTIIDHVPPVFGFSTFSQIANNYNGTKSFKKNGSSPLLTALEKFMTIKQIKLSNNN